MCRFITCSVITFATVIAITKDLPDVEGDRKYGIETFSTRLGTRAVAFLGEIPALLLIAIQQCPVHAGTAFLSALACLGVATRLHSALAGKGGSRFA